MKKILLLVTALLFAAALVFTSGCVTITQTTPQATPPAASSTTVIITPTAADTPAPAESTLTVQNAAGTWYGKYNPETTRFVKVTIDDDGKCDAVFSKVSATGNREDIDIRKGSITLKDDGTWNMVLYNDREQTNYNLIMTADKQQLAETSATGLSLFRDRNLAGIPVNVNV